MISITIKNLAEFQKTILRFPERSSVNFNKAIDTSLEIIHDAAIKRGRVPFDTGTLRAGGDGGWFKKVGNFKGILRNDVSYAIFVHDGTKFMAARPFLQQGVTEQENKVNKIFNEALVKTLKQV